MTGTSVPGRRPLVAPSPPVIVAMVTVVLAATARAASMPVLRISDAALHLGVGRYILATGSLPRSDPFTYTRPGAPWVVQQWLAEVTFAVTDRVAGSRGLGLLVVLLVAATAAALAVHALRLHPGFWSVVVVGLALAASTGNWTLRGNLFSFVLLLATSVLLRQGAHPAWFLPLFAVWANVHGLVFVGVVVVGLHAVGRTAEIRQLGGPMSAAAPAWIAVAAATAGTFLTPWGADLHRYALGVSSSAAGIVSEWGPPSLTRWDTVALLILAVLTIAVLLRSDHRGFVDPLLAAAACLAGAAALRNVTVAALLLALVAVRHPPRPPREDGSGWSRIDRVLAIVVVSSGLIVTGTLVAITDPFQGRLPLGLVSQVDTDRIWTEDRWASHVLLLRGPEVQVNIDARFGIHGREGYDDYVEVLGARPGYDEWLHERCVGAVLVLEEQPLAAALGRAASWTVAGRETVDGGTAVLFERDVAQCRVSTRPSR